MPKARNQYECFECKKTIEKGEEYERRIRYDNPDDKKYGGFEKGIQKCICLKCINENRYSYIDDKYNKILSDKSVIKFGIYCGEKWVKLTDDYMIYIYSKIKKGKNRKEIVAEFNRRLNLTVPCSITPLNEEQRVDKIEELKKSYIENKNAEFKSLSIPMEKAYRQILKHGTVSYRKYTPKEKYESWYVDCDEWAWIETQTILALYNRGLLKPIEFTDNLLDFRPIKYEAIKKDIAPKKSNRLTKRTILEWAKENDFGIRENIVWKTTWLDGDKIKLGYKFTFTTSLKDIGEVGYSISCYGTLNEINKYNSLDFVNKIREEIYKIETETNKYVHDKRNEIYKDKYSITTVSYKQGYGWGGKKTTPFYDENIRDFIKSKY